MRFRLIEKDGPGAANVGLDQAHNDDDNTTPVQSKTYIPSSDNKKVDMNKIKNTKIGDDIHYYINGIEGRGIVTKMGAEYLEVFKENGQIGNIHINDTFFVKDILINKQWDDMDDTERYEALMKIHAPTPRYITKSWGLLPEEIKVLLRKEGSTYEEGETKDSETQDHARTGSLKTDEKMTDAERGKKLARFREPPSKDAPWYGHADRAGTTFEGIKAKLELAEGEKKRQAAKEESKKSDVEHGTHGNPGNTAEVGVSTDTKVDVAENTGYEERPHISVEEAGKLPRTTFNEGGSELHVSGSQDSKDKPKFSQPTSQEQPVRKAGLPQQHPNTYGMRYGMKGGVKKVWCPEHQVWEETTKDWHE